MAEVIKATIELFDDIYPLLQHFAWSEMDRGRWIELLTSNRPGKRDYFGYVLMDKGVASGFLGGFFHERNIDGRTYPLCNLFCWYVVEEQRHHSLLPLLAFLREPELTITSLTPSKEACLILKKFNFRPLDTSVVILPLLPVGRASTGYELATGPGMLDSIPDNVLREIIRHHQSWSQCLLIYGQTDKKDYCIVIFNKVKKKRIYLTQIYYISNLSIFIKNIGRIQRKFLKMNRTFFTVVDQRLLKDQRLFPSFLYTLRYPRLYRSKDLKPQDIDNLYTELLYLKRV